MMISDGVGAFTKAGVLGWIQRKLATAGYTLLAGKVGMIIAKAGCVDGPAKSALNSEDSSAQTSDDTDSQYADNSSDTSDAIPA
jgi:hypothetical protein